VVGVGLALRLAHVASVAAYERAHVVPGLDRWLDMEIAEAVAAGDPLGGTLAPYDSAPAYALLLGFIYRAGGRTWTAPLVLQALLGATVPLLLYGAGRRLASVPVGVAAAALAAVYAPAIFYEGLTVKFALVPFAVSALLCALAAATGGTRRSAAAVAAGASTALAVALRPNAIILLPLGLAWIAWRQETRRAVTSILFFALGLFAIATPLAARRMLAAERGDAASLWGIHFFVGSQLRGDGGYTTVVGVTDDIFGHVDDARAVAEASLGHPLTPGEVSRYWFDRGIQEIRGDPWGYVRLLGRKLHRLVATAEEGDFGDDWMPYASQSAALRTGIGFGTVAPLAVLGLMIAAGQRSGLLWAAGSAAAYALSLLVFFVAGRYRLPIVPPMLLLAGAGIVWLGGAWTARPRIALLATALLVGVPAALGVPRGDLVRLVVLVAIAVAAAPWVTRPR